jgi:hypothetical protein
MGSICRCACFVAVVARHRPFRWWLAFTLAFAPGASSAAGLRPPIAHAGDARTVEGGERVTLDGSYSWDADGDALTFTWTQTEGPSVALDLTDPARPSFTAPTPGLAGVVAQNQVLAFNLEVSDGSASSTSEVRIMVLKPFNPVADGPAVVTNGNPASYDTFPAGSFHAAIAYTVANPGTRLTFAIPASDPSYNAAGGYWDLDAVSNQPLRYDPHGQIPYYGLPRYPPLARGITIDGTSQRKYAEANGIYVAPEGPVIRLGQVVIGGVFDDVNGPERIVVRGLVTGVYMYGGKDIVLSGNYFNVWPGGQSTGAYTWRWTCTVLGVRDALNLRIGGATREERNLFGPGCYDISGGTRGALSRIQFVGNYVGLDPSGSTPIGANQFFFNSYNAGPLELNIGGVTPGSRNLFAGFGTQDAVMISLNKPGDRAVVKGNYMGTDVTGTVPITNRRGLIVNQQGLGPEWIVGGPEPGAGNLISGNQILSGGWVNTAAGLQIDSPTALRLSVQGNRIGTTADGMRPLPNNVGVVASGSLTAVAPGSVLIGGSGPGEGNLISGNFFHGMQLGGLAAVVPPHIYGNLIGIAADGVTPLGNGYDGITSAGSGLIGGLGPGEANVIAYNGENGVGLGYTPGSTVRGNAIFGNGSLGLSLRGFAGFGGATPLPNDCPDVPRLFEANLGRNFPELFSATTSAGGTTVTGQLCAPAGLSLTLDFYDNDSADPTGYGEGQTWIGSANLVAGAGQTPFSAVLPVMLDPAHVVTATATDSEGNTSEFSRFIVVTRENSRPVADSQTVSTAEDTPLAVELFGSDADGDDLTFEILTPPSHGALSGTAPLLTYTPNPNFVGDDFFSFRVSDGTTASEPATITIDVTSVNDAPSLTNPGDQSSDEGEVVTLAIAASDPDGDTLSFSATGLPPGPGIDPATGAITGLLDYSAAGAYPVTVTVDDYQGGTASVSFTWTVNNVNRAPSLSNPGDQSSNEGDGVTLAIAASDPDGDTLSFSATGLPPESSIDAATGRIFGTLTDASAGSHPVTVSVSDGRASASVGFVWNVTERPSEENRAPVCSAALPSLTAIWPPNHKLVISVGILGVTDPDGDPLRITIVSILQDEPTNTLGDGTTWIDGFGVGTSTAQVRAERSGTPKVPGNGRVYEVGFRADDGRGGSCSGAVLTGVPHDQGKGPAVDDGVRYDSTVAGGPRVR